MKNFYQAILITFLLSLPSVFIVRQNSGASGGGSNTARNSKPPDTPQPPAENKPTPPIVAPAPAKTESNILFVIDSSGSMKALVEGKSKMEEIYGR